LLLKRNSGADCGLGRFGSLECHCSLGKSVGQGESPDLPKTDPNAIAPPEDFIVVVLDLNDVEWIGIWQRKLFKEMQSNSFNRKRGELGKQCSIEWVHRNCDRSKISPLNNLIEIVIGRPFQH
jgi:hypothetical protein